MGKVEVEFVYEKETRNTYRYEEVPQAGKPPVVRTLYVQKWALPSAPKNLKVTIEWED